MSEIPHFITIVLFIVHYTNYKKNSGEKERSNCSKTIFSFIMENETSQIKNEGVFTFFQRLLNIWCPELIFYTFLLKAELA